MLQVPGTATPAFAQHRLQPSGTRGCAGQEDCNLLRLPTAAPGHTPRCHPGVKPKRASNKGGQL